METLGNAGGLVSDSGGGFRGQIVAKVATHSAFVARDLIEVPTEVKQAYPRLIEGAVVRYQLDRLHGLNFVMEDALEGCVNGSLNLDSHGKSWSYLLLALEVEVD